MNALQQAEQIAQAHKTNLTAIEEFLEDEIAKAVKDKVRNEIVSGLEFMRQLERESKEERGRKI